MIAIAITLIALPLVDDAGKFDNKPVLEYFRDNTTALIAAAISFLAIAIFWRRSHRLFRRVTDVSNAFFWTTMLWLAAIVFMPVATVLNVGASGNSRGALLVYVATITMVMILSRIQQHLAITPASASAADRRMRRELASSWTPVALLILGLGAIAIFGPLGSITLLLLTLIRPLEKYHSADRRHQKR